MRTRRCISVVLILAVVLLSVLSGCKPAPLGNLDIPKDCYLQYFSPVKSAVLYVNGTQQQIAADDPRLIRLLDFLAYSADSRMGTLTQGVFSQSEMDQYDFQNAPVLEVTFAADAADKTGYRNSPRILVSGDTYFLYMNPETYGGGGQELCAERHWPYSKLAPEGAERSNYDLSLGGDYWLDILKHCGF